MTIARGKHGDYEVTTWYDLVRYGRDHTECAEGEMPQSFTFGWSPVCYEKGHGTYLVTTESGVIRFHDDEVLLVSASGHVLCVSIQAFNNQFKIVG